jgi:hypothetical protein
LRLVRVKTPEGRGPEVARLAFDVGISEASIFQVRVLAPDGRTVVKDEVNVET